MLEVVRWSVPNVRPLAAWSQVCWLAAVSAFRFHVCLTLFRSYPHTVRSSELAPPQPQAISQNTNLETGWLLVYLRGGTAAFSELNDILRLIRAVLSPKEAEVICTCVHTVPEHKPIAPQWPQLSDEDPHEPGITHVYFPHVQWPKTVFEVLAPFHRRSEGSYPRQPSAVNSFSHQPTHRYRPARVLWVVRGSFREAFHSLCGVTFRPVDGERIDLSQWTEKRADLRPR